MTVRVTSDNKGISVSIIGNPVADQNHQSDAAAAASSALSSPPRSSSPSPVHSRNVSPVTSRGETMAVGALTVARPEISLEQLMIRTQETYTTYNTLGKLPVDQKEQYVSQLKQAYLHIHAEGFPDSLRSELTRVLVMFAKDSYGSKMEDCRKLNIAAVALQLRRELPKASSLDTLVMFLNHADPFKDVTSQMASSELLSALNFTHPDDRFFVGKAIQQTGFAMQNLIAFKEDKANVEIFRGLQKNGIKLFEEIGTPNAKWEKVESLYNPDRFLVELEFKKDFTPRQLKIEKLKTLAPVEALLAEMEETSRVLVKKAQILNIRGLEADRRDFPTQQKYFQFTFDKFSQARSSSEKINVIDRNAFLHTMYLNNKIVQVLKAREVSVVLKDSQNNIIKLRDTLPWIEEVITAIQDHKDIYFVDWYNNAAKIKRLLGDFEGAKMLEMKALQMSAEVDN